MAADLFTDLFVNLMKYQQMNITQIHAKIKGKRNPSTSRNDIRNDIMMRDTNSPTKQAKKPTTPTTRPTLSCFLRIPFTTPFTSGIMLTTNKLRVHKAIGLFIIISPCKAIDFAPKPIEI